MRNLNPLSTLTLIRVLERSNGVVRQHLGAELQLAMILREAAHED
jgi:hypothetical protein